MKWDFYTSKFCKVCKRISAHKAKEVPLEGLKVVITLCGFCDEVEVESNKLEHHYEK